MQLTVLNKKLQQLPFLNFAALYGHNSYIDANAVLRFRLMNWNCA
ncbi:hypothetical protein X975_14309, partial [Stegodyphus mimosarum]